MLLICRIVFLKMLLFCIVIFSFLTSNVEGIRQHRTANNVNSTISSIISSNTAVNVTNTSSVNKTLVHEDTTNNSAAVSNSTPGTLGTIPPQLSKSEDKVPSTKSGFNDIYSKYASGAALRGLYVFVGLSAVVMLYIAVKLIRLRRKKTHIRKYGLLANAEDLEMAHLDADDDDDDEDTTLFDAHNHIGR